MPPPGGKSNRQSIESQQLTKERFGGRHSHLDPSTDIKNVGHLPGQRAFGAIGHAKLLWCVGAGWS